MKTAIILVRSMINSTPDVRKTLELLKITKRNSIAIVADNEQTKGMIKKLTGYATWGPINEATEKKLGQRRTLNSPRKGFGRKGVKMPFSKGGALGERKEKINDLIERML